MCGVYCGRPGARHHPGGRTVHSPSTTVGVVTTTPARAAGGGGGGLRCTLLVLSCRLFLGSSTSSLAHVPARDLPRAVWFEVDLSAVRVRLVGCRLSARAPYGWRLAWARAYFPPVNLGFIRFERKINDLNSEGLIFTSVI